MNDLQRLKDNKIYSDSVNQHYIHQLHDYRILFSSTVKHRYIPLSISIKTLKATNKNSGHQPVLINQKGDKAKISFAFPAPGSGCMFFTEI